MSLGASRESVAKNTLILARDAAHRFPEQKVLIKKFLESFQEKGSQPDPTFGHLKYKALLRRSANRFIETIHIDLSDVHAFAQGQMEHPDEEISEAAGVPKMKLLQSAESLTEDIESNAMRFMKFFYDACEDAMPERDHEFNVEQAEVGKDMIQQWRQRMVDNQKDGGGDIPSIPARLRNNFDVRFKPRSDYVPLKLRDITAKYVGSLVQLDCLVVRVSQVKPKIEVVTYHCEVCGGEIFQTVEGERFTPPKECPSERCKENKNAGKLNCNLRTCKFAKYQEMRVQEMSEHVPVGGVPRSLHVAITGDLTRSVLPGDAIQLTGVFVPYQLPWFQSKSNGTTQQMFVEAHFIKKHKNGYNEKAQDEAEHTRKIEEAARGGSLYECAARSIAPEIFGHVDVKKALLLALVGSFTKTMKDGMKIRGDVHTLLMGDPGVAKSQLLKQAVNIAPRSVYTTGKGSSGVGLTAAVVRDANTGEVTLEGGALVLADKGVCCIDEFDKMEESDRTAIHEVMEQQTVSIAKAGITTTLNTRTTILAAANPAFGRYNPYKSPVENINLPPSLLSRFDLLFLLLDTVDNDKDRQLALHVCKVHSSFATKAEKEDAGDKLKPDFDPFDSNVMRTYIRRAKSFEPYIDDSLKDEIVDAYVNLRIEEKRSEIDSRKSYTTPRTLLAIMRLSQAHARSRFSNRVERQDFEESMRLTNASKESVELSVPTHQNANPLDLIYEIIADLSRRCPNEEGWVEVNQIVSMAGHSALTSEMVAEAIDNWESISVLCQNPEKTMVRFIVPISEH